MPQLLGFRTGTFFPLSEESKAGAPKPFSQCHLMSELSWSSTS
jgi:hypothetical protein